MRSSLALLLALLTYASPAVAADPVTWPQWRGPSRDGRVDPDLFPWPNTLDGLKQTWRVELSDGYPSPVVSADRVFTAESKDGKELVHAYDRANGKLLWSFDWTGRMVVPFFALKNGSWIRSTPAFDGKSLYVGGMRELLVSLDAATGKENWRIDFVDRYKTPLPSFGFVCSPLVTDDGLYVQAAASFIKLDKSTGKEIWRVLQDAGGMNGSAFSSPVLARIAGREQVVVQTRDFLAGVDPATGTVLWQQKIDSFRGMNILTPTVFGEGVFTSTYGGVTQLLSIKPAADTFQVEQAWKLRIEANMSSPVVLDGHAYLHRRDKRFSCIDLASGQEKWTVKAGFSDYASLVTDGQRILALDAKGELMLIKHNVEKFELLAQKKVSEQETWGHLVVCGNELFIREQRGLAKWIWGK